MRLDRENRPRVAPVPVYHDFQGTTQFQLQASVRPRIRQVASGSPAMS